MDSLIPVCPPIEDAMDGGKIDLTPLARKTLSDAFGDNHEVTGATMYDCVWLVKFPDYKWDWDTKVYIYVTAANLETG